MERMRTADGFTLIEVLVAMFVLTVGILALINTFDSSRKLTLVAERRASIAHLAQRELERLQSAPYEELAMTSAPTHSTNVNNPDYYVDYNSSVKCKEVNTGNGCFAWNSEKLNEEQPLVIAAKGTKCPLSGKEEGCGVVSPSPTGTACSTTNPFGACEWTVTEDGKSRLSGDIYDFVTYQTDSLCSSKAAECPTENDYKRVTVVVTVNVPAGAMAPVRVSTIIANPKSARPNPLTSAATECENAAKEVKSCVSGIGKGNAQSWFLHDSGAEEDEKEKAVPTPQNGKTHATITANGATACEAAKYAGCPKPDFMDGTSAAGTKLYDYSTDEDSLGATMSLEGGTCEGVEREEKPGVSACYGGRILVPDKECYEKPTGVAGENAKGEMWITEPMSAEKTKLTAAGALSLYSQTVGGSIGREVTLCLAVYDVPEKIENLVEQKPTEIAYTSYKLAEWPASLEEVSFVFEPAVSHELLSPSTRLAIKADEIEIAQHHRIGLRLWEAPSATNTDISIAYDTHAYSETVNGETVEKHGYPSVFQLNTE